MRRLQVWAPSSKNVISITFDAPMNGLTSLFFEVNAEEDLRKPPLGIATMLLQEFFDEAVTMPDGKGTYVRCRHCHLL